KLMRREALFDPMKVVPVTVGSPKPVPDWCKPASSMNGSILRKLGWLNALSKLVRNSNEARSVILKFLNIETFAMLLIASVGRFRRMLPNGLPNMLSAIAVLAINRTWFLVTALPGQGIVGLVSHPDLPIAVKSINWFGA